MLKPKHHKILIPVELTRYVYHNNLGKAFGIYLFMKMFSDGKLNETSSEFNSIATSLNIKDKKTFKIHFNKLLKENWIGYNKKSGYYFIRNFDYIRSQLLIKKRRATVFYFHDLQKLQAYIIGVIIGADIKDDIFYWEAFIGGRLRTATNIKDVAIQSRAALKLPKPKYYGKCKWKLAELLNCSPTRATELKQMAEQAGYISYKHRFTDFAYLNKADFKLQSYVNETCPDIKGRLRFKYGVKLKDGNAIKILIQTYDEITPLLTYKSINKFKNLKVTPLVAIDAARRLKKIA